MPPPDVSGKLDVITLENLHIGIMDVTNCVNNIIQKLNVFQEIVKSSNLKR